MARRAIALGIGNPGVIHIYTRDAGVERKCLGDDLALTPEVLLLGDDIGGTDDAGFAWQVLSSGLKGGKSMASN